MAALPRILGLLTPWGLPAMLKPTFQKPWQGGSKGHT